MPSLAVKILLKKVPPYGKVKAPEDTCHSQVPSGGEKFRHIAMEIST